MLLMQKFYPTFIRKHKPFIHGQLLPFMTGFNSAASNPSINAKGGTKGQNLGHIMIIFL